MTVTEIAEMFIANMFDWAGRAPDYCAACGELENYVLSRTTYGPDGQVWENCPQDLYQTVSLPEGFNELDDVDEDLVIQYLGDVWPDLWRDAVAC